MTPIWSKPCRAAETRGRRRKSLPLWAMLAASGPALGAAGELDYAGEIAIIAGEVARLQQLDPDVSDIRQFELQVLSRTVGASFLAANLTLPSLQTIDQLADLAELTPPLTLQAVSLRPGGVELLALLPDAECSPPLRARLDALPSFATAVTPEIEAVPTACRLRWRDAADSKPEMAPGASLDASVTADAHGDGQGDSSRADLRSCAADQLDAALDHLWQAIDVHLNADAHRARRTSMTETLAAIDARVAAAPALDNARLLSLATNAGALQVQIETLGEDPPTDQSPANRQRRITAKASLPVTVALLESLIGQRQAGDEVGQVLVSPWINRSLSSVELVRAVDGGAPMLTIVLRQFEPFWHAPPPDAASPCWPTVSPGDGKLSGLSAATRARVDEIRQRYAGPLRVPPEAALPAVRAARQVAGDPFN